MTTSVLERPARPRADDGRADDATFVTLTVADQLCGIPVLGVRDVLGEQVITRIPLARSVTCWGDTTLIMVANRRFPSRRIGGMWLPGASRLPETTSAWCSTSVFAKRPSSSGSHVPSASRNDSKSPCAAAKPVLIATP